MTEKARAEPSIDSVGAFPRHLISGVSGDPSLKAAKLTFSRPCGPPQPEFAPSMACETAKRPAQFASQIERMGTFDHIPQRTSSAYGLEHGYQRTIFHKPFFKKTLTPFSVSCIMLRSWKERQFAQAFRYVVTAPIRSTTPRPPDDSIQSAMPFVTIRQTSGVDKRNYLRRRSRPAMLPWARDEISLQLQDAC